MIDERIEKEETRQEKLERLLREAKGVKNGQLEQVLKNANCVVIRVKKEFYDNYECIPEKEIIRTKKGDYVNIFLSLDESELVRNTLGMPPCYICKNKKPCYPVSIGYAKKLLGQKAYA
jgi:hypothetical protein